MRLGSENGDATTARPLAEAFPLEALWRPFRGFVSRVFFSRFPFVHMHPRSFRFVLLFAVVALLPLTAHAQLQQPPRFGVGFQMMGSTAEENVGPGLRLRVSAPVNRDLSLAFGMAFTGYIFEGQDDATYAFDPQASVIVTMPVAGNEGTYFMGGVGAYLPAGDNTPDGGPTFHLGAGKVWLLRDSSLFAEIDPAILIGENAAELLIPVRVGVIF